MNAQMRNLRSTLIGFCVLASFLISVDTAAAQNVEDSREQQPVSAEMRLANVRIKGESISEVFAEFALRYEIPVSLEIAKPGELRCFYRIDLGQGTLSDLLTQFVAEHDEYTWRIEDGIVRVFPKVNYRDSLLEKLLATEIDDFSVRKGTVTWTLSHDLFSTPEVARILEPYSLRNGSDNFSGFSFPQIGKEYSFTVSHMKLQSILDKVVKESPVAKFWTISNNLADGSVTLIVNADFEYPPEQRYLKHATLGDELELWP
jgi:hypothetical protein